LEEKWKVAFQCVDNEALTKQRNKPQPQKTKKCSATYKVELRKLERMKVTN
jgi:hypothetical protein